MNCDELSDSYELYALGVLDGDERGVIEDHLGRKCENCTAGVRNAIETNTFVTAIVPAVEPPARLRERVLSMIGAPQAAWSWNFAWAGAAAAMFAGILWFSIQDRRLSSQVAELRAELAQTESRLVASDADLTKIREAMAFLSQPGTEVLVTGRSIALPPSGRAFVNRSAGVLLIADQLPPTGAGKIYEMWVIPRGGAPRPAGLFQPDANGNAVHLHLGPVEPGAVVAVTVEPEAGSPAPTSTPIIVIG